MVKYPQMKICIFDDDEEQLRVLINHAEAYIRDNSVFRGCEVRGFSAKDAFEADIRAGPAVAYLLDIGIAEHDTYGIEAAKEIRARHKDCHILFITAHTHLAREALQGLIRPSGYICKGPLMLFEMQRTLTQIFCELSMSGKVICLVQGKSKRFEPIDGVLYARYDNTIRKTEVMLTSGGRVAITESLAILHKRLGDGFFLINRQVLVNKTKIRQFDIYACKLTLVNDEIFSMSRSSAQKIKKLTGF